MTVLDYEVNTTYNRQRVAEIRDSVRAVTSDAMSNQNTTVIKRLRYGIGGALIAAGQNVCGSSIRCKMPRQTVVGRASS